jgi:hypothetical protein
VRKIGSSPAVNANRSWSSDGVIVQADEATWQEEQDLPLVPRLWKNGFDRSSRLPSIVMVRSTPDGSGVSILFCWPLASVPEANEMAAASVQIPKQRPSRARPSAGLALVGVRRHASGAERFEFRSQEENNMMLLLSRAGLRYHGKAIASARRPIAGMVPGRRGLAWR